MDPGLPTRVKTSCTYGKMLTVQSTQSFVCMWQAGNTAFQQQRHQQAADEYSRAINVKVEDDAFNAVLYCNRAAAYHAVGRYVDAIADCFTAAALDASYVRVLQRRADAYVAIGDHTNAAQVHVRAYSMLCCGVIYHCSSCCICRKAADA